MVLDDPNLRQCKREFCMALSRTIKNEYSDLDAGLGDYMIAIMRAAVAGKYGYGTKAPIHKDFLNDPKQRKKWFQTWAFNYLRQILTENKIATTKVIHTSIIPVDKIIVNKLLSKNAKISVKKIDNGYEITDSDKSTEDEITDLNNMYFNKCSVEINGPKITIRNKHNDHDVTSEYKSTSIKEHSFDIEEDDYDVANHPKTFRLGGREMAEAETITTLRNRIPEDAKPILDIYLEDIRPDHFIQKYGDGKPKAVHIAEYLGLSLKEVKKIIKIIKIHLMILSLGY